MLLRRFRLPRQQVLRDLNRIQRRALQKLVGGDAPRIAARLPFAGRGPASGAVAIARAALDGISRSQGERGVDLGAQEKPIMAETIPTVPAVADLGFEQLAGPRGVADDLKKLPGISPAIEKQLNDLGIFHYTQIAELSATAAHNVGEEVGLPGRVDGWVAKAKQMTAEAE